MTEQYGKFRRGDMNLDDRLQETEFLYVLHPEHNPQSIKDLVDDMIENFDRSHDKVKYDVILKAGEKYEEHTPTPQDSWGPATRRVAKIMTNCVRQGRTQTRSILCPMIIYRKYITQYR